MPRWLPSHAQLSPGLVAVVYHGVVGTWHTETTATFKRTARRWSVKAPLSTGTALCKLGRVECDGWPSCKPAREGAKCEVVRPHLQAPCTNPRK